MSKVTRRITDPRALGLITKFRAKIKTMPNEQRLCPTHNEAVSMHEDNFSSPVNAPNFETVFTGCCDEAIDEEMKFVTKAVEQ
jgi:hypothetical protein